MIEATAPRREFLDSLKKGAAETFVRNRRVAVRILEVGECWYHAEFLQSLKRPLSACGVLRVPKKGAALLRRGATCRRPCRNDFVPETRHGAAVRRPGVVQHGSRAVRWRIPYLLGLSRAERVVCRAAEPLFGAGACSGATPGRLGAPRRATGHPGGLLGEDAGENA